MAAPVRSLLFATNLSAECVPALETAVSTAARYRADLVLLHVVDREVPTEIEEHFKGVLGEEKWAALKKEHEQDARQALIGKMSPGQIGQKVLRQYCADAGIDAESCDFNWQEVVAADKNIAGAILGQAKRHGCDMIVLGAGKGFLGGNAVGSTIKGVLKKAQVPVLVVPSKSEG
ncbi:MAG: universal stress protein [Desulfobacteraceae bacterium]|nr:universal stress protein [Desulfobacteraceae bacterium]